MIDQPADPANQPQVIERKSVAAIKLQDKLYKPTDLEQDSMKLSALYYGQARQDIKQFIQEKGLGDKVGEPIQTGIVGALVRQLSTLYAYPAKRMLMRAGEILPHDSAEALALAEIEEAVDLDVVWAEIDALRILFNQVVVTFCEDEEAGEISVRVFEPHNVYRYPSASSGDCLDDDEAFLLQLVSDPRPDFQRYQLWQQEEDGWHFWVIDGANNIIEKPYGESGLVPFAELPAMIVTSVKPLGRAWIPIPQSRIAMAQTIDGLTNEILLLIKHQGHARQTLASDNPAMVSDVEVGPDQLLPIGANDKFEVHQLNPAIEDANRTLDRFLALLAVSEDLPADTFASSGTQVTGAALKVRERALERRRQKYARLASRAEAKAYKKIASILDVASDALQLPKLDQTAKLVTTFARQGQETDDKELQDISFKELAVGTKSVIEHLADMRKITHDEAIALYQQVQDERDQYPIQSHQEMVGEAVYTQSQNISQNPGSLVSGPKPALGPTSGQKTPGAFNPQLGTSTEGASVVDAVKRSA